MAGVVAAPTQCVEDVVDSDPGGEVVGRLVEGGRVEGDLDHPAARAAWPGSR